MVKTKDRWLRASPNDIRFTQEAVDSNFDPPHAGRRLDDTVDLILSNRLSWKDFPPLRVLLVKNQLWTLDNRRLWVFRKAKIAHITVRLQGRFDDKSNPFFTSHCYKVMSPQDFIPQVRGVCRTEFDPPERGHAFRCLERCQMHFPYQPGSSHASRSCEEVDAFPEPKIPGPAVTAPQRGPSRQMPEVRVGGRPRKHPEESYLADKSGETTEVEVRDTGMFENERSQFKKTHTSAEHKEAEIQRRDENYFYIMEMVSNMQRLADIAARCRSGNEELISDQKTSVSSSLKLNHRPARSNRNSNANGDLQTSSPTCGCECSTLQVSTDLETSEAVEPPERVQKACPDDFNKRSKPAYTLSEDETIIKDGNLTAKVTERLDFRAQSRQNLDWRQSQFPTAAQGDELGKYRAEETRKQRLQLKRPWEFRNKQRLHRDADADADVDFLNSSYTITDVFYNARMEPNHGVNKETNYERSDKTDRAAERNDLETAHIFKSDSANDLQSLVPCAQLPPPAAGKSTLEWSSTSGLNRRINTPALKLPVTTFM